MVLVVAGKWQDHRVWGVGGGCSECPGGGLLGRWMVLPGPALSSLSREGNGASNMPPCQASITLRIHGKRLSRGESEVGSRFPECSTVIHFFPFGFIFYLRFGGISPNFP